MRIFNLILLLACFVCPFAQKLTENVLTEKLHSSFVYNLFGLAPSGSSAAELDNTTLGKHVRLASIARTNLYLPLPQARPHITPGGFAWRWARSLPYSQPVVTPALAEAGVQENQQKEYLVSNDFNEVQVIRCTNYNEVREALQQLSAFPQVCIGGVSNSGKSSVLNHLMRKPNLAKSSSVAGKTRSIDFFLVNSKFVLVDLPGLPSRDGQVDYIWRTEWRDLCRYYLDRVRNLRGFMFIHDVRWRATPEEVDFVEWIDEFNVPDAIMLLSKDDLVGHDLRKASRTATMKRFNWDRKAIHYCSDNSNANCRRSRRQLLRYIEHMVDYSPSSQ